MPSRSIRPFGVALVATFVAMLAINGAQHLGASNTSDVAFESPPPVATPPTHSVELLTPITSPPTPPPTTTTSTTTPAAEIVPMAVATTSPPSTSVGERCLEWHDIALEAGWRSDLLARLDTVMWRESRCLPHAWNTSDPASGSRGLIQVNGWWCRSNRYSPVPGGWLETQGVASSCEDLFDPLTNLRAGWAIFNYSLERNGCGWSPWATRNTNWC